MTYEELVMLLWEAGYERIEHDDRLFDIFPREIREKGVELWERSQSDTVQLVRIRLPYSAASLQLFQLPRAKVTKLLSENRRAELEVFPQVARGDAITRWL